MHFYFWQHHLLDLQNNRKRTQTDSTLSCCQTILWSCYFVVHDQGQLFVGDYFSQEVKNGRQRRNVLEKWQNLISREFNEKQKTKVRNLLEETV